MSKTARLIRTRSQAKAFILKVGICGIFSNDQGRMPCLWDVVDLPERQPGEKGWGQRVIAVWTWKDELPALYPEQIFYGKIPNGLAVLMSLDHLWETHYPIAHRSLYECSPLARKIYALVSLEPMTSPELRREMAVTKGPAKTQFDKALLELQATLNVVRRNSLKDARDTWVPFTEQHLPPVK